MKITILVTIWMTILLSAVAQEKPMVLSTTSIIYDIAKNIGGDNFSYSAIVLIGSDPHQYKPTADDAQTCQRASIILTNGLSLEEWLLQLIEASESEAAIKTITEGVVAIASEQSASATDPHAWMSAANGLIYSQNIRDAFIAFIPEKADDFRSNYKQYKTKIEALDQYISRKITSIPEDKRTLITSHDAFQYYGRRYRISLEAIPNQSVGIKGSHKAIVSKDATLSNGATPSNDADAQTSNIQILSKIINTTAVPAVFIETTNTSNPIAQFAKDKGLVIGGKLYTDALTEADGPAGTYLKMLRYDTDIIYDGLILDRPGSDRDDAQTGKSINWLWGLLLAPIALALLVFVSRIFRK